MTILNRTLLLAAAATALTACNTGPYQEQAPNINRIKIQVAESIERLELYPRADGLALSARDHQAMVGFLAAYAREGDGPIFLNQPERGGAGAASATTQLRSAMAHLGLDGVAVKEGRYPTAVGSPAPVVVSYRSLKAIVPDCRSLGDLTKTYYNSPNPEWGCAFHANIAAQISDPNQLLQPYESAPVDPTRRGIIYEKYITGEPTGSTRPGDQTVSSQGG